MAPKNCKPKSDKMQGEAKDNLVSDQAPPKQPIEQAPAQVQQQQITTVKKNQVALVRKRFFVVSFASLMNTSPAVCFEANDMKDVATYFVRQCIQQEKCAIIFDRQAKRSELENRVEKQEHIHSKLKAFGLELLEKENN